jgi:hypothetical protein
MEGVEAVEKLNYDHWSLQRLATRKLDTRQHGLTSLSCAFNSQVSVEALKASGERLRCGFFCYSWLSGNQPGAGTAVANLLGKQYARRRASQIGAN